MTLKLYNTMSRREEEIPFKDDELKMYVCGITPYDHSHLGHAMSYIIFDVLRRYLEYRGYKVKHVQNYTDIDDRIIIKANAQGLSQEGSPGFAAFHSAKSAGSCFCSSGSTRAPTISEFTSRPESLP